MTKTNHELARAAAGVLWKQDRQTFESVTKIIEDAYAEAMVELDNLRRQVEFVKRENAADTSDDGTGCCMLCFCDHNEKQPHDPDCPHAEAGRVQKSD